MDLNVGGQRGAACLSGRATTLGELVGEDVREEFA